MHAGLAWIQQQRHQTHQTPLEVGLDVFPTQRDAQRLLRSIWDRAEGLGSKAEAADRHVRQAKQQGRDARKAAARARRAWARAVAAFHHAEPVQAAWQEITAALQLFQDDGPLNEPSVARRRIAQAIPRLSGADWSQVIRTRQDPRSLMFLERLHRQFPEAEPDPRRRVALVRLGWRRRQRSRGESFAASVAASVQMQICAGLGADWAAAYRRVSRVLGSTVRASSAVECRNRVIRMPQARHRTLTPVTGPETPVLELP